MNNSNPLVDPASPETREAETMESQVTDQMIRKVAANRSEACLATALAPEDFLLCFRETEALAESDFYFSHAQTPLAEPFAAALTEQARAQCNAEAQGSMAQWINDLVGG